MSRNIINILWVILAVLFVILIAVTLFRRYMVSLIDVEVQSVRRYGIEDFCQMTGMDNIPSEIEQFINGKNHGQYMISEVRILLNNQTTHTFKWNAINAKENIHLVYYPYTIMWKNHISKGTSSYIIILVSDTESERLTGDKQTATLDLIFERPLLKLNKVIEVSLNKAYD